MLPLLVTLILLAKVRGTAARSYIVLQSGVVDAEKAGRTIYSQRGVAFNLLAEQVKTSISDYLDLLIRS